MNALRDVYIIGVGAVLPGPAVDAAGMEARLGLVGGRSSALGRRALRWNGIETRHYALDDEGRPTTSSAAMCADAVRTALDDAGRELDALEHLATATTQGDLLVPGHGSQVHGELGGGPLEVASFQSVCASSLMAAKSAWLSVRAGEAELACAAASEFSSRWFRPEFYEGGELVDGKGRLALEAEFLRWTLSDGAGAVVMAPAPRRAGLSLKVEWIDLVSLAGSFDPVMWAGATAADRHEGSASWSHVGPTRAHAEGRVALLQDFGRLKAVIRAWLGVYLRKVEAGRITPEAVDWLLCHYSARSLREEIVRLLEATGGMIPEARWWTNLTTAGNVGAASIWVMLDGFLKAGLLRAGQRVLCVVPESGRAMVGFMMLTAVQG